MTPLAAQLAHAYRREERLYARIRDLVKEQARLMETQPDPGAVFDLCSRVETLMAEITTMEEALESAKTEWGKARHDPDGELNAVLTSVEVLIEEIARTQERVQRGLVDYMRQQKERTDGARRSIKVSRASRLYRPERGQVG